jgi:hypothetical protein
MEERGSEQTRNLYHLICVSLISLLQNLHNEASFSDFLHPTPFYGHRQ